MQWERGPLPQSWPWGQSSELPFEEDAHFRAQIPVFCHVREGPSIPILVQNYWIKVKLVSISTHDFLLCWAATKLQVREDFDWNEFRHHSYWQHSLQENAVKSQFFAGVFSTTSILFTCSWWVTRRCLQMITFGENIRHFFFLTCGHKTSTKIDIKYRKAVINIA